MKPRKRASLQDRIDAIQEGWYVSGGGDFYALFPRLSNGCVGGIVFSGTTRECICFVKQKAGAMQQ